MPIKYTDAYWDHLRDERKHEPRPSDIPLRLQPKPLSTAMDVAILVRALDNIEQAAALIETFVDERASEQRLEAVAAGAHA
jgi:hypothetical protein